MISTGLKDFYQLESLWKIMKREERSGNLKKGDYSLEVEKMSSDLSKLRKELRVLKSNKHKDLTLTNCEEYKWTSEDDWLTEIEERKQKLEDKKKEELRKIAEKISRGEGEMFVETTIIKEHQAFVAKNVDTRLVCQIIKLELRRCYRLLPSNMNSIIEGLKGLLDNPMPKILIRADIKSFFESIPQQELIDKLRDDGFITRRSLKYLRQIMFEYNEISDNHDSVGVPRGLAFSSYLSELYMQSIDRTIKQMDGIYYYKRYVDDMVLVANPEVATTETYWENLSHLFGEYKLTLHEDSKKKFVNLLNETTECADFEYLGYRFMYSKGKLNLRLSEKRFTKYHILIDALFDIYAKCANYRTGKKNNIGEGRLRIDALKQLFERLKMLTSNGMLSGRKNYVATGIYYSNKHLTDYSQLQQLDEYLSALIEDINKFNPPMSLFNYEENNGYQENLVRIKERLHRYSFQEGFHKRKIYKNARDSKTLLDLQRIYHKKHEQILTDIEV